MPRYRIQFSKEGPARYWSHLDLVRTFERAFHRADLPVLYTQGFNPHPRFSFAAPLPVGMAGEKEYLELELEQNRSPEEIFDRLSGVFPAGLRIKAVRPAQDGALSLMAAVVRAVYRGEAELTAEVTDAALQEGIRALLVKAAVKIPERKARAPQTRNIRPGIFRLEGRIAARKVFFEMELQTGSQGHVRPEEVLTALAIDSGLPVRAETAVFVRTALIFKEG